ncbi:glycoside hydrolase family 3 C-terminal domain-containing protein [Gordonia insulae]|uniref:Thermostable beta-glucosidase B n=1 Tax=Gordonia insulae TaxID=2420509 RepID=A0A3G8JWU9_9ACTN|nr:glycoside hydrolase family 3 C-terminal domain-containing protein [Gordonia insulae]AZG48700.1 Thermostable beta-glucosidase B [Gordonia insulae]
MPSPSSSSRPSSPASSRPSRPIDHHARATEIVAGLSVADKAALGTGASFWYTVGLSDVDVRPVMLTDGPHGIRKQGGSADALGLNDSVPAVCFPPAVGMASTFDADLIERVGDALGVECIAERVGVLLGPGVNIKRSPLGGRNFEYLSEDPYLTGRIGAALVRGVQRHGIGTSVKHFAVNNQEHERLRVSADVDERPLHEIYLRAFEHIVGAAQPWTVMASYNRINGVYATENHWLLTETLRDRWGFDGLVVSDWMAVDDRVAALAAGLDLEMPSSGDRGPGAVRAAAADDARTAAALEAAACRVVELALAAADNAVDGATYDHEAHHRLAREVARRCPVLLKNDPVGGHGPVLPLSRSTSVAVIGEFARTPRYQGGGSSKINPFRLDTALDEMRALAATDRVTFAPGFALGATDSDGDTVDGDMVDEAVAAARQADVAVVFLGLGDDDESEGFDRADWTLPAPQLDLLRRVIEANPRTAVVLSNGGVVDLDEVDEAPAVLEGWLLGQAGGGAIADILYGLVDPSGRLAETIPLRLEDSPAFLDFPGEQLHVRYGEGVFVGYRWYDARRLPVRYPFGHGLSYTTIEFDDISVAEKNDGLHVGVTVSNTGERPGRAIAQVYIGLDKSVVARPPRELKAVGIADLEPGEHRRLDIEIARSELAYWDRVVDGWVVEGGEYQVQVGASSRDIRLTAGVAVAGDERTVPISASSTLGEVLDHPTAGPALRSRIASTMGVDDLDPTILMMVSSFPIGRIAPMLGFDETALDDLLA